MSAEAALSISVPLYKRMCYVPIGTRTDGVQCFEDYIRDKAVDFPLSKNPMGLRAFALDDSSQFADVLDKVCDIFQSEHREISLQ